MRFRLIFYLMVIVPYLILLTSSCRGKTGHKKGSDSLDRSAQSFSNAEKDAKCSCESVGVSELVYVVIADTGANYKELDGEMKTIRKTLNIPIDMKGRYYSKKQDRTRINDQRRDLSNRDAHLIRNDVSDYISLEYFWEINDSVRHENIAIVAGIVPTIFEASILVARLKPLTSHPFVFRFCNHQM